MCIRDSRSDRLHRSGRLHRSDRVRHHRQYRQGDHSVQHRPQAGQGRVQHPGFRPGPGPVSYTHLDVYKRQQYGVRLLPEVVQADPELIETLSSAGILTGSRVTAEIHPGDEQRVVVTHVAEGVSTDLDGAPERAIRVSATAS